MPSVRPDRFTFRLFALAVEMSKVADAPLNAALLLEMKVMPPAVPVMVTVLVPSVAVEPAPSEEKPCTVTFWLFVSKVPPLVVAVPWLKKPAVEKPSVRV